MKFTVLKLTYYICMDVKRFGDSPVGTVVPIEGVHLGQRFAHFAFVPHDLPSEFSLSTAGLTAVSRAAEAIGRLDGVGRRLPTPSLIVRPTIRREAVSTSALEGTFTTLPQVLQSELFESEEAPSKEVQEVLAYVRASEEGYRRMANGKPLSLNLIKDLHGILVERDHDIPDVEKGAFRLRQNFIGPRNARVEDSHFVPPPINEMREGLHRWEEWIHRDDVPLLVRVALGHYLFEVLHPFVDGNGRIGRLIAILMLLEARVLTVPLLSISPYFEARDDEYRHRLRDVSMTGDYDSWVRFFLNALTASAEEGLHKSERLLALREEMVGSLRQRKVRGLAIQVAEDLIGSPFVAPAGMAARYGVTYQAAAYAIRTMVAAGLLEEQRMPRRSRRSPRRVFAARRVLEAIG